MAAIFVKKVTSSSASNFSFGFYFSSSRLSSPISLSPDIVWVAFVAVVDFFFLDGKIGYSWDI